VTEQAPNQDQPQEEPAELDFEDVQDLDIDQEEELRADEVPAPEPIVLDEEDQPEIELDTPEEPEEIPDFEDEKPEPDTPDWFAPFSGQLDSLTADLQELRDSMASSETEPVDEPDSPVQSIEELDELFRSSMEGIDPEGGFPDMDAGEGVASMDIPGQGRAIIADPAENDDEHRAVESRDMPEEIVMLQINDVETGAGKYNGVVLYGGLPRKPADDVDMPEGLTPDSANPVLIINAEEEGQPAATHNLNWRAWPYVMGIAGGVTSKDDDPDGPRRIFYVVKAIREPVVFYLVDGTPSSTDVSLYYANTLPGASMSLGSGPMDEYYETFGAIGEIDAVAWNVSNPEWAVLKIGIAYTPCTGFRIGYFQDGRAAIVFDKTPATCYGKATEDYDGSALSVNPCAATGVSVDTGTSLEIYIPDLPGVYPNIHTGDIIGFDIGRWATVFSQDDPIGTVKMYNGSHLTIPVGWHLCDGTDGTPDMHTDLRFPRAGTVGDSQSHATLTSGTYYSHTHTGHSDHETTEVQSGTGATVVSGKAHDNNHTNHEQVDPPYYSFNFIIRTD